MGYLQNTWSRNTSPSDEMEDHLRGQRNSATVLFIQVYTGLIKTGQVKLNWFAMNIFPEGICNNAVMHLAS